MRFGLSLVYWIRSDGDTCLKVDICHHLNGFSIT